MTKGEKDIAIFKGLTLSHMTYEVLFTIWQGGQLAIPLKMTFFSAGPGAGAATSRQSDYGKTQAPQHKRK
jgi:hypothetical protein